MHRGLRKNAFGEENAGFLVEFAHRSKFRSGNFCVRLIQYALGGVFRIDSSAGKHVMPTHEAE